MIYGLLIMLLPLVFALYKVFLESKIKTYRLNKKWQSSWGEKKIKTYHKYLSKHNSYYNKLNEKGKSKFIKRTYNFIHDMVYYGKAGVVITEEIKVVIASAAIQLTFGHKEYLFQKFRYIFVYPEPFYSKIFEQYLKGGTYPTGVIAISWSHFLEGYQDDEDGINLGLHEMAHTMLLQLSDDQFETYIDEWFTISRKEFLNIKEGNSIMFRSYAGTNRHEFLAVAIECFFEQPKIFKKKLPKIYTGLKVLLNQDPLNDKNNYKFDSPSKKHSLVDLIKSNALEKYI